VAFLLVAGIIIIIIILYAKGRLRAGKCSKCGSPWLGIGVCPECAARAFGRAARGSEDEEAAHRARRAEEQREKAGYRRTEDEETKFRDGANGNQGDSELVDPFAVLGLRPGASKEEIRGAYLNLIGKYHPDKVAHLGIEFQEPAKTKTIQLIRAYDMLRDK
jgi:DnaJ-domain-containing protein 1